jgi:hypothetical protein
MTEQPAWRKATARVCLPTRMSRSLQSDALRADPLAPLPTLRLLTRLPAAPVLSRTQSAIARPPPPAANWSSAERWCGAAAPHGGAAERLRPFLIGAYNSMLLHMTVTDATLSSLVIQSERNWRSFN